MKLKTNKAIAKRFKKTKNGKIIKRTAGQGHGNMRETGKTGRNKKRDLTLSATYNKTFTQALPNG